MKTNEIKKLTKEGRENRMAQLVMDYKSILLVEVFEEEKKINFLHFWADQLKLRVNLLNNMRIMRGKRKLNAYDVSRL